MPIQIRNSILILSMSFFLFGLTGCANANAYERSLSDVLKMPVVIRDYLDIKLVSVEAQVGMPILLYIENRMNECIVLPHNFGISIFAHSQNKWIEIPDLTEYPQIADIVIDPKGSIAGDTSVIVNPDYSLLTNLSQIQIRIAFVGHLCQSEEYVGDYIEISVNKP